MPFSKYKTALLIVLAIGVTQISTSGFGQIEPAIDIVIHQRDGEVTFEFFTEDTYLFFIKHKARVGVSTLYIKEVLKGETIWSIEMSNLDSPAVAREVRYAVVPDGFNQDVPRRGAAPSLKINAAYEVAVLWGGGPGGRTTFIYQGAKSP